MPTVVLTNGDDHYTTQNGVAEVIWAGAGNDSIRSTGNGTGLDPGDYICGGRGNDTIYDDYGNDRINGGGGDDKIKGSPGADVLKGGAGDDVISDDPIDSNLGADTDILRGGTGNDTLITGFGADRAYGGRGNDDLYDLECDPTYLSGGAGADYFESYLDSYGINGSTCDQYDGHGGITVSPGDTIAGGSGFDRAMLSRADTHAGVERATIKAPQ